MMKAPGGRQWPSYSAAAGALRPLALELPAGLI